MSSLSLGIAELLGMSLGVDQKYFREFFEDNDSIMRLNYYPPCQKPDLTLGTGPHCDPTSLTLLHQDQVGGLQVFVDEKWHYIGPKPDAFVVNIGDTFMVSLSIYIYMMLITYSYYELFACPMKLNCYVCVLLACVMMMITSIFCKLMERFKRTAIVQIWE